MHVNKLQRLGVARVRMKNVWEPQVQGEFVPAHRVFSTDLRWAFMRKTGWGEKTSLRVQAWRRGVDTEKARSPARTLLAYGTKSLSYWGKSKKR